MKYVYPLARGGLKRRGLAEHSAMLHLVRTPRDIKNQIVAVDGGVIEEKCRSRKSSILQEAFRGPASAPTTSPSAALNPRNGHAFFARAQLRTTTALCRGSLAYKTHVHAAHLTYMVKLRGSCSCHDDSSAARAPCWLKK
jgi:hypothetical protein